MHLTIYALLFGVVAAAPQYDFNNRGSFSGHGNAGNSLDVGGRLSFGSGSDVGNQYSPPDSRQQQGCPEGQVLHLDGSCVQPIVERSFFLYNAPAQEVRVAPAPALPSPKVHYNYVFLRTPEQRGGPEPIVVPPPSQKTLVYVLNKAPDAVEREVIEVPSTPTQPEVFFVNYNEGDNPSLPGGIDLRSALGQSVQQGQIIEGGFGSGNDYSVGDSSDQLGSLGSGRFSGGSVGSYSAPVRSEPPTRSSFYS